MEWRNIFSSTVWCRFFRIFSGTSRATKMYFLRNVFFLIRELNIFQKQRLRNIKTTKYFLKWILLNYIFLPLWRRYNFFRHNFSMTFLATSVSFKKNCTKTTWVSIVDFSRNICQGLLDLQTLSIIIKYLRT